MAAKGITEAPTLIDTIIVKGEVKSVGQEALTLHFTNKKKSGGGEILIINLLNDDQATITFHDAAGQYVMQTYVIQQCNVL